MQPDLAGSPTNGDWADAFGPMPKLPSRGQRWTVKRKAALIEAVRGGWLASDEASFITGTVLQVHGGRVVQA